MKSTRLCIWTGWLMFCYELAKNSHSSKTRGVACKVSVELLHGGLHCFQNKLLDFKRSHVRALLILFLFKWRLKPRDFSLVVSLLAWYSTACFQEVLHRWHQDLFWKQLDSAAMNNIQSPIENYSFSAKSCRRSWHHEYVNCRSSKSRKLPTQGSPSRHGQRHLRQQLWWGFEGTEGGSDAPCHSHHAKGVP